MSGGGVAEGQVGCTGADDGRWREEAEGLAQNGGGVGEGVEEVRGRCDAGGACGDGSEDVGVFGTESGQGLRVAGEDVVGVAEGAGGGVVTGEEEQFDLRRSLGDERIGGGRVGGCHQVTLESEVDDGFRVGLGTVSDGLPVAIAL